MPRPLTSENQKMEQASSPGIVQYNDPDPDPEPEPPAAPPVIILAKFHSKSGKAKKAVDQEQDDGPCAATSPPSSEDTKRKPKPNGKKYNLRKKSNQELDPDSEPDPNPFPEAPPIIILSKKRRASKSPSIDTADPATASPRPETPPSSPHPSKKMGSKVSKLPKQGHGKLQPSQNKSDKAEMKEPSNYYTHRSKSMRRKAGVAPGAQGSGGGLGGSDGSGGSGGGLS
ncbi:hypothetical protein BU24DRAFT_496592 [Aaosphaeria arxii CBS 175.79]|uniref:Uncharacterized protein n=1 Tax=Aaosphaeria arxii CBS 175.79 TaxID=1450172 RepID=A0A6A5XCW1_9PLEO|nr:uncharacterized protein BU24DRAFT_496592 [Aaosphaeria arxii CBS 175.79]KAF2010646.1 hypothetical protein BU24DRAFT_496592 [Aaosphaeria arxii CBS 175.79]